MDLESRNRRETYKSGTVSTQLSSSLVEPKTNVKFFVNNNSPLRKHGASIYLQDLGLILFDRFMHKGLSVSGGLAGSI